MADSICAEDAARAVSEALHRGFIDAEQALSGADSRLDDREINIKLSRRVGEVTPLCTPRTASTELSLVYSSLLGRRHHARGPQRPRLMQQLHGPGHTATLLANDHLKSYIIGFLTWPRDRVTAAELHHLLAGTCQTLHLRECEAAVCAMDSSDFLTRDSALHAQDLARLFGLAEHPTFQSLRHLSEMIASECNTLELGQTHQPKLAKQNRRIASAAASESLKQASQWQTTTALVKTLAWMRDLSMLELAESARAQKRAKASVRVVLNPEGLISVPLGHGRHAQDHALAGSPDPACEAVAESQRGTGEQPWLQVDLVVDVPRPSPAVAFAAVDEACTGQCTPVECQMALRAAGVDVEMGEVLLLAKRYHSPGARHPLAAPLLWPALLRDLGVVPGGMLPPGTSASITSLRELVSSPPRGQLSPSQWRQLEVQVRAWEGAARTALEATCGHYTRDEQLLPFLKLRPRGVLAARSAQHACVAVRPEVPGGGAASGEQDSSGGVETRAHAPERPHVVVQVVASVRVFVVVQEAVGRLPGRVWVSLDAGPPPRSSPDTSSSPSPGPQGTDANSAAATASGPRQSPSQLHPVLGSPVLHAWAATEAQVLCKLRRLFRAIDVTLCGTCSCKDFRYVAMVVLGKDALSRGEMHVLCEAFAAAPLRHAAARASGTDQRVAYMDFLAAVTPALALVHAEKASVPTRQQDSASACRIMCQVAAWVFPGLGVLRARLLGAATKRREGAVAPVAAFVECMHVAAATCDRAQVAELGAACRAAGSPGVSVDALLQVAAIALERRAAALLRPQ